MGISKGIRYSTIIVLIISTITTVIHSINRYSSDIDLLKRQSPALAAVYISLESAKKYLSETEYYVKEENYEYSLKSLNEAQEILNEKKINNTMLKSLVHDGHLNPADKEGVITVQNRIKELKREIYAEELEKFKRKRKGLE